MPVRWIVMLAVLRFNYLIFSNSLPGIMWPTSFVWQSLSPGYSTGTIGTKLEIHVVHSYLAASHERSNETDEIRRWFGLPTYI